MKKPDFTTTLRVDKSPEEALKAITNVRGWWSENIEGGTDQLNDEFFYHYKDIHFCKMKLIELIPDQKAVWLVQDNYFKFTKDENEWKGTKIIFDILQKGNQTEIRFTHEGLVPQYECYDICREAWTGYIQESLHNLIANGKGQPTAKQSDVSDKKFFGQWKQNRLTRSDYTTLLLTEKTPEEVFNAINNVIGWWSASFEGNTQKLNDTFTVHFGEVYITSKVAELVAGRKIAWLVTDCNKPWLKNKKEWNGTTIIWEISEKDNKTQIRFTHMGLVPEIECYGACANAWGGYLHGSLINMINTGEGKPTEK